MNTTNSVLLVAHTLSFEQEIAKVLVSSTGA